MEDGPSSFEVDDTYSRSYIDNCIWRLSQKMWAEAFGALAKEKHLDYGETYQKALETGHLRYIWTTVRTEEGRQKVTCHIDPSRPETLLRELEPDMRNDKKQYIEYHMNWNTRKRKKHEV